MSRDSEENWTIEALGRGDLAAIKQRVLNDPNYLRSREIGENTPLMFAIEFDDFILVEFMLGHGADSDPIEDEGRCGRQSP